MKKNDRVQENNEIKTFCIFWWFFSLILAGNFFFFNIQDVTVTGKKNYFLGNSSWGFK